jgi:hypothetical protein
VTGETREEAVVSDVATLRSEARQHRQDAYIGEYIRRTSDSTIHIRAIGPTEHTLCGRRLVGMWELLDETASGTADGVCRTCRKVFTTRAREV